MTEVVSIKFKNRGKAYYFSPAGLELNIGDEVIVDTANGMEMAVVSRENHPVEDTAVVQPLRRVLRKATQMDLRAEEIARQKEQNAMTVCREKIAEHGLDMKLVDVECNFEGTKTTFFFTSDGRVDFRALVKDLAGILHNRIELRQIGVRDEAKLLGGLGICGRPYCCNLYMDDFHPVSTKMAKVQSLSLNPAKISGSCGRLMCCLRYEQEAYEDLVKKVPKQGAFVETKDGYGTAVQVNLLRSTVKVRLGDDREDALHEYKSYELAAVPGGRPKEGAAPPHVLEYVEPEPEEEADPVDEWALPTLLVTPVPEQSMAESPEKEGGRRSRRARRGKKSGTEKNAAVEKHTAADSAAGSGRKGSPEREASVRKGASGGTMRSEKRDGQEKEQSSEKKKPENHRSRHRKKPLSSGTTTVQTVEARPAEQGEKSGKPVRHSSRRRKQTNTQQ